MGSKDQVCCGSAQVRLSRCLHIPADLNIWILMEPVAKAMPVPSSTVVVFVSEGVLADFLSGKTLPPLASDPLPTKGIFKSAWMNHMSSGALGLGPAVLFLSKPFTCRPSGSFPCGEVGVE